MASTPFSKGILELLTDRNSTTLAVVHVATLTTASKGAVASIEGILVFFQMNANAMRTTVSATTIRSFVKVAHHLSITGDILACSTLANALGTSRVIFAQSRRTTPVQEQRAVVNVLTPGFCRPLSII